MLSNPARDELDKWAKAQVVVKADQIKGQQNIFSKYSRKAPDHEMLQAIDSKIEVYDPRKKHLDLVQNYNEVVTVPNSFRT
jgi:hypothetical protein